MFFVLWDFLSFFVPNWGDHWPLFKLFVRSGDAGGQNPLSRAVLRSLLAWACVFALLLPLQGAERRRSLPWGYLFIFFGLLSSFFSGHALSAELEWEIWALVLLLGGSLLRLRLPELPKVFCISLYIGTLGIYLHSLVLAVPGTLSRLGGIFHHANILSTFALGVIPFFLWRASKRGKEGALAGFCAGSILALQIWTNSLTGSCLLLGALAYWCFKSSFRWRAVASLLGFFFPFVCNVCGGGLLVFLMPMTFLILLGRSWYAHRDLFSRSAAIIFFLSLILALGSFVLLTPEKGQVGVNHNRGNSGIARTEFYRTALSLWLEKPVLGQGPRGFVRAYPRRQSSLRYYSKFVHCVPLEILLEWGLLAFVCAVALWWKAFFARFTSEERSRRSQVCSVSALFVLIHSLTGVQSQFPYLLIVLMIAWCSVSEHEDGDTSLPPESVQHLLGRIVLLLALMTSVMFNSFRIQSAYDQSLAREVSGINSVLGAEFVERLLFSSMLTMPLEAENALVLGRYSLDNGKSEIAACIARSLLERESDWAAVRELQFESDPSSRSLAAIDVAISLDPWNYPSFYRYKAEQLALAGEREKAQQMLESHLDSYNSQVLLSLPEFRRSDLQERLVEYCLALSILEEQLGREQAAERAFRLALTHCDRRVKRFRKLLEYDNLKAGPSIKELLNQLADQIPSDNFPSSVNRATDQSQ